MVHVVVALTLIGACGNKKEKAPPPEEGTGTGSAPVAAPPPVQSDAVAPAPPVDPQQKIDAAMPTIRKMAADAAIVGAIGAQNAKKMSLDAIKKLDAEWTAAKGLQAFMKPYLENPCATALEGYQKELPAIVEAFAMDDQGGLVCAIRKTSDYWQGDEAKWQKSFAGGSGADFIDKPSFDDSSQTYSVQVSLPVKQGDKAIGALTIGLGLDKL